MKEERLSTPLFNRVFIKCFLVTMATILVILGAFIMLQFAFSVDVNFEAGEKKSITTFSEYGTFGDFIAGVVGTLFSLAGFFLLYLTLKDQRENFHRERLESNYFQLIAFHRENVNEIQYTYYEKRDRDSVTAVKRKVFKIIFLQFKELFFEVEHFFDSEELENIYLKDYLETLSKNKTINERQIDLKQLAQLDIIYTMVFFGLSKEDRVTVKNICRKKYNSVFIDRIIAFAILKPKKENIFYHKWDTINKHPQSKTIFNELLLERADRLFDPTIKLDNLYVEHDQYAYGTLYPDDYEKYYGGHQFRLGHYFRHLYQTVNFIDNEVYLTYQEKYSYLRILRGQLSNYEQIVFFLSSLSEVGRVWELEYKKNREPIEVNKQLITKYNFIKNVPIESILEKIEIRKYYPLVDF